MRRSRPSLTVAITPRSRTPRLSQVITGLPLAARELVNVAAVIGRAFTFEVLKPVSAVDEDMLVQALDEMWQHRVIREQPGR